MLIEAIKNMPLFIEAPDKRQLVAKMMENNMRDKIDYKYFSVMKDGKKWVAWYYGDGNRLLKQTIKSDLERKPSDRTRPM